MVKFGNHIAALSAAEGRTDDSVYLVPYGVIARLCGSEFVSSPLSPLYGAFDRVVTAISPAKLKGKNVKTADDGAKRRSAFTSAWQNALRSAVTQKRTRLNAVWKKIFERLFETDEYGESRGMRMLDAVRSFKERASPSELLELRATFVKTYEIARTNGEALRKLVKKHDKYCRGASLKMSVFFMPELYASGLLEEPDAAMVDLMETRDDPLSGADKQATKPVSLEHISLKKRANEIEWLQSAVASMEGDDDLLHLVAHRGFHDTGDGDLRPLENSIDAYELAWTSGIKLCECDITLTRDRHIVLCHDRDLQRLAMLPGEARTMVNVSELTLRELIAVRLKSGTRPPLLKDILRSAIELGDSQMVIEIKSGNSSTADALCDLIESNPGLLTAIAVIMSFDAHIMHIVKSRLISSYLFAKKEAIRKSSSLTNLAALSGADWGDTVVAAQRSPKRKGENDLTRARAFSSIIGRDRIPKLLLLTVSQKPDKPYLLELDIAKDVSRLHGWLTSDGVSLDGVYLQFQDYMLTREGIAALRRLSSVHTVGVWGYAGRDPDSIHTLRQLVREAGVSFVNSDLPRNFLDSSD